MADFQIIKGRTVAVYIAKTQRACAWCDKTIEPGAAYVRIERGPAHLECKVRQSSLLATGDAASQLGLTSAQFLKLANTLGLQPEAYYRNPHYRSGPECPLWPPEAVVALRDAPEVAAIQSRSAARRVARQRKAAERDDELAARYSDWRDAVLPAAEALFNLNRYAKWDRCAVSHRREIYGLKNDFIRLLYDKGYAVQVLKHKVERDDLECRACDGFGCERCEYTGIYRKGTPLVYIAFRFKIGEQFFAWHQPQEQITWKVEIRQSDNSGAAPWEPEGEKPVSLSPRHFADAKALVRYVLAKARDTDLNAHTQRGLDGNDKENGAWGATEQPDRASAPARAESEVLVVRAEHHA
jgi:hypothetical protein